MIDLPLIHCGLVELELRAPFHIQVHAAVILLLGSRREKLETVKRSLAVGGRCVCWCSCCPKPEEQGMEKV